jgi:hypothetical protein
MKFILSKMLPALCVAALTTAPLSALAADASPSPSASPSASASPSGELDPSDLTTLRPMVGQTVTLAGTVLSSGESKTGTARYLHFTKDWNSSVSIVFFVKQGEPSKESLEAFVGKKVRVTGKLELYKDQVEIKLDTPTSVEVVQ